VQDLVRELSEKRILIPFAQGAAYTFLHRAFAEFLTATELARRLRSRADNERERAWELADKKAWDPDWEQIAVILAGTLWAHASLKCVLTLFGGADDGLYRSEGPTVKTCRVRSAVRWWEDHS
jgi:hypothetical protein